MSLTATTTRRPLTPVVNALRSLSEAYGEAYDRETAWDGGEFSGPAMSEGYERAVRATLAEYGWTAVALEDEILARTSGHWAFFHSPLQGEFTATCDTHGRQDIVASSTTRGFDPSLVLRLACGCVTL